MKNIRMGIYLILFTLIMWCKPITAKQVNRVCLKKSCFDVELVMSPEKLQEGLMQREDLLDNQGMLFLFPDNSRHSFWMKNTLIPLDIIWINPANRIVHIEFNAPPCEIAQCHSYRPDRPATYVLEVKAGQAQKSGFLVGSKVSLKIDPRTAQ